jgi:hypothetical protein
VLCHETKDHLLSTKWGQGYPWNQRAPYTSSAKTDHCLTGCVPVAAAQVLYYLHYKIGKPVGTYGFSTCNAYIPDGASSIVLSSSDITFNHCAPLHWADFPLNAGGTGQHGKVSTLMMRIGYLYGAAYHRNATYSYTGLATTYFPSEFSVSCSTTSPITTSQLASISRTQIYNNELPILMSVSDNAGNGHSIVIDGYDYLEVRITYSDSEYPNIIYTTTETSRFLAINWGWDGVGDSDASGNTIWYNLETSWIVSSYNFTSHNYIVSGFSAID